MNTASNAFAPQIFPGFTYYDNTADDNHLRLILSYPVTTTSENVVIEVNFTDVEHDFAKTCSISRSEYPALTKTSTIAWGYAKIKRVKAILTSVDDGSYVVKHSPCSKKVMNKIIAGASKTTQLTPRMKQILREQKLIPYENDPTIFDPEPFK